MTPEEARALVDEISTTNYYDGHVDSENRHILEDALYHKIVHTLAEITDHPDFTYFDLSDLVISAKIALETETMEFNRWFS